ncbi:hypothetical protein UFOVP245_176 [uncultured Caudovirales phage]|uniref:Uncharacterized protein n=1 Tax=uncultured Caudovirales phage TaxID=2100421 RepID=A0A6J7WUS6_9CAUD|nr:hypothetical protein UFOVP245_176 [uncultured Caudovirales phage]
MNNLSPEESKKVEHHLAKAEEIHNKLPPEHHDIVSKHDIHFSTYINKTVRTGEKPSTEGLRTHIAQRMGNEIDKVKTDKAKAAKTENMNSALAYHDTHEPHFTKALQIHHNVQTAKDILTTGLHKAQVAHNPMTQSIEGEKSDPEGYVVKHKGEIIKMVHRGKFSQANFKPKTWAK